MLFRFWYSGWAFDWFYHLILVRPFVWLVRVLKRDFFDNLYTGAARTILVLHLGLSRTENGRLRTYAMGIVIGAVLAVAIVVFT
jgi:NADH-quinone oxidoreductase subunit L